MTSLSGEEARPERHSHDLLMKAWDVYVSCSHTITRHRRVQEPVEYQKHLADREKHHITLPKKMSRHTAFLSLADRTTKASAVTALFTHGTNHFSAELLAPQRHQYL